MVSLLRLLHRDAALRRRNDVHLEALVLRRPHAKLATIPVEHTSAQRNPDSFTEGEVLSFQRNYSKPAPTDQSARTAVDSTMAPAVTATAIARFIDSLPLARFALRISSTQSK